MNDKVDYSIKQELDTMIDDNDLVQEEETPITKIKTRSFKRFYLENLLESPLRTPPWPNPPWENWAYNSMESKNFIQGKKGQLVDTINYKSFDYLVYKHQQSNYIEYFLLFKSKPNIMGYVKLINDRYIFTNGLWNTKLFETSNGLIRYFFLNWLLPKYRLIISDSITTNPGELFWKKIIDYGLSNNKEVGIYYEETNKFEPLNKIEDFEQAWNKGLFKRIYIKI